MNPPLSTSVARRTPVALPLVLAAILAFPSACSNAPNDVSAETSGVTVRDSAGVEIVEIPTGHLDALPLWGLSEQPVLSIGVAEGEAPYLLTDVLAATRFADGTIGIFERSALELRIFSAEGAFLRAAGGVGGGPQELTSARYAQRLGPDRFVVFQWDSRRVKELDLASGTWTTGPTLAVQCGLPPDGASEARCLDIGLDGEGRLIMEGSTMGFLHDLPTPRVIAPDQHLWAQGPSDIVWLDSVPVAPIDGVMVYDGGRAIIELQEPALFHPGTVYAPAGRGVVTASTHRFELRFTSPESGLTRIIRADRSARPVTQADLDAVARASATDEWTLGPDDEYLEEWELGEYYPLIERVLVDAVGRTWVAEYEAGFWSYRSTRTVRWIVFERDGRPLARVQMELPYWPDLLESGDDYVLMKERDEFDVPSVRMYRLGPKQAP